MRVKLFAREAVERMRWVEFPLGAPRIDNDGWTMLEWIATTPGLSKPGRLCIADLESPIRNLKLYVPQDVDLEQLNTLAIKIGYMEPEEQTCFEGALELNSVAGMEDVLHLADALDQYEIFLNVSSMAELGRYLVNNGIIEFPESVCPYLDFEKIGIEYDAIYGGVFKGTSYVTRKEDAPEHALDAGRDQVLKVHLYTSKVGDTMPGPYCLTLPACEERLEKVKKLIGVDDFAQARIEQVEYSLTTLQEHLQTANCPTVEILNALAEEIEEILQTDNQLLKLCGVLEVEQPQTLEEALRITQNLDDYERLPCGSTPTEYGSYVITHSDEWFDYDELLDDLQRFIDKYGYGRYRMQKDGIRITGCGLIRRLSEPFSTQKSNMALWQGEWTTFEQTKDGALSRSRADKALAMKCIEGLAQYAVELQQNVQDRIAALRKLVGYLAGYWCLKDEPGGLDEIGYRKVFDRRMAEAGTTDRLLPSTSEQKRDTVYGLYRYAMDLIPNLGVGAQEDVLGSRDLIREIEQYWNFSSPELDHICANIETAMEAQAAREAEFEIGGIQ